MMYFLDLLNIDVWSIFIQYLWVFMWYFIYDHFVWRTIAYWIIVGPWWQTDIHLETEFYWYHVILIESCSWRGGGVVADSARIATEYARKRVGGGEHNRLTMSGRQCSLSCTTASLIVIGRRWCFVLSRSWIMPPQYCCWDSTFSWAWDCYLW